MTALEISSSVLCQIFGELQHLETTACGNDIAWHFEKFHILYNWVINLDYDLKEKVVEHGDNVRGVNKLRNEFAINWQYRNQFTIISQYISNTFAISTQ